MHAKRKATARPPEPAQPAAEPAASVQLSPLARDVRRASQLLASAEAPRPDRVARAKAILDKWRDPSDERIDKIMDALSDELPGFSAHD